MKFKSCVIIAMISSAIFLSQEPLNCQSDKRYHEILSGYYNHSIPLIKPEDLKKIIDEKTGLVLLDTREPGEYMVSHLKNTINVGYNAFNIRSVQKLPTDRLIILYCSVGHRSEKIGELLINEGFTRVFNLYGGIFEWINKGYPIVGPGGNPTTRVHAFDRKWGKWLRKGIRVYD